jgi:PleD family two-component response regulator
MVVTDWLMPEMDGIELCKRLRATEAGSDYYILILTGRTEEERIVEAFDAGADDYLVKPWSPKVLLARIRPGKRVIELTQELRSENREKDAANKRLAVEKRRFKVASMTDALTELPNRRGAMKRLEKDVGNGRAHGAAALADHDRHRPLQARQRRLRARRRRRGAAGERPRHRACPALQRHGARGSAARNSS